MVLPRPSFATLGSTIIQGDLGTSDASIGTGRSGASETEGPSPGADPGRLTPLRERQLVQAYRDGDAEALVELLRSYQRRIYGVCARMAGQPEEARDLTQDALVRVMEGIHTYDGRAAFSTWVVRVTINCCLSRLRRERLRRHGSLDTPTGPGGEPAGDVLVASRELSPPGGVEQGEMRRLVLRTLETLDPEMRAILVLRDLQGLDYRELAEALEVPVGTVKSRLFRARAALRSAAERELGDTGDGTDRETQERGSRRTGSR